MHLDWNGVSAQSAEKESQSAIHGSELPPKCKNCTLKELAVIKVIQTNASATQKQIAAEIGLSERTVKTITSSLVDKGIIVRKNGKRNGFWALSFL